MLESFGYESVQELKAKPQNILIRFGIVWQVYWQVIAQIFVVISKFQGMLQVRIDKSNNLNKAIVAKM